jgi:hypothetical protein
MERGPDFSLDDVVSGAGGGHVDPPAGEGGGRRPAAARVTDDHLLARSPWWMVPLGVSLVIGAERVLMLSFAPGFRELGVAVFGALFVATFSVVLAAGGLYVAHYRR